jgi:PKD repeat protein
MALVQTYGGLVRKISDVVPLGCCCASCCEDVGGPPTADFSYTQTDADPCCFSFTDLSTAGTCGSIVSYSWDFGDGDTSTSENPTHCYDAEDAGPWDVTLTVTDASGCTDSVVTQIARAFPT